MAYKNQRVKVIKAFRVDGADVGVDSVIDLALPFALELRGGKKVEFADPAEKLVRKPLAEKVRKPSAPDRMEQVLQALEKLTALVTKQSGKGA